jgi:hypothetical protein
MSSQLVYEPIPEITRTEIEQALKRNDPEELLIVVLSAALYLEPEFAELICLQLTTHPHFIVRGNAILGFSHIARLHNRLNKQLVKPLIINALTDKNEYVRGHARDVREDLEHFLNWKF